MTYTLEDIRRELDEALRARPVREGKSVNQVAIEALSLADYSATRRDLSDIAGTWIEDPEVEAALRDQDKINPEIWR